ncbi:hypothetical protein [Novipirellula rosea]|uniref:Uncharacterized protein n=1 Tax=Novipirellula rosea TaxID=1031540 RepID=A0ABP8MWA6_9BACT
MANQLKRQRNRTTDAFCRRILPARSLAARLLTARSLTIGVVTLALTHNTFGQYPVSTNEPTANSESYQESPPQPIQMAPEFDLTTDNQPEVQAQPWLIPSVSDNSIPTTARAAVGLGGTVSSENAVVIFVRPDADPLSLGDPSEYDTDTLLGSGSTREQPSSEAAVRDAALDSELKALMKPIGQIAVELGERGKKVPENVAAELAEPTSLVVLATGATVPKPDRYTVGFYYKPLYFEQANLERCGNHYGVFQNAVSGCEFLSNVKMLPYHSVATPACHCVCSPGDCLSCEMMPKQVNPFPIEPKAALMEAAAIAGFILLLQ